MNSPGQSPANQAADLSTQLAVQRTLMAADRSLMAWVRTGLSMVSFGFTIYKILQGIVDSGAAPSAAGSPRQIGLFLIGLGTISVLAGTWEYWNRVTELGVYRDSRIWRRPSLVLAIAILATGLVLWLGIISRTF